MKFSSEISKESYFAWKWVGITNVLTLIFGFITICPTMIGVSGVFLFYLWTARENFGVMNKKPLTSWSTQTINKFRKIFAVIINLIAFPGFGQMLVGRTMTGVKLYCIMLGSVLCMIVFGFGLSMSGMDSLGMLAFIVFFILYLLTYLYAVFDIIKGDVLPYE